MKNDQLLDLYSDYLISAFGQTTATGLATLLQGEISHDQLQRFLAHATELSPTWWRLVKPHLRRIERPMGC